MVQNLPSLFRRGSKLASNKAPRASAIFNDTWGVNNSEGVLPHTNFEVEVFKSREGICGLKLSRLWVVARVQKGPPQNRRFESQ